MSFVPVARLEVVAVQASGFRRFFLRERRYFICEPEALVADIRALVGPGGGIGSPAVGARIRAWPHLFFLSWDLAESNACISLLRFAFEPSALLCLGQGKLTNINC